MNLITDTFTKSSEQSNTTEISHPLGEHLEYGNFDDPVVFRITYIGQRTIIPSYETSKILRKRYGLDENSELDQVSGGLGDDERLYWEFAFDASKVSDPESPISDIRDMLEAYNTPPEDLTEEQQEEWRESTVKITKIESNHSHPVLRKTHYHNNVILQKIAEVARMASDTENWTLKRIAQVTVISSLVTGLIGTLMYTTRKARSADAETTERDSDLHICTRCGERYAWEKIEPPEDATFYWVPNCPACHADMTAATVGKTWLNIIGASLEKGEDDYQRHRKRVHYHARLYHGRLANLSTDEVIALAQHFDDRASVGGRRVGPQPDRNVAFNLRKQAQRQSRSNTPSSSK
jgi:cytochrome c553